MSNKPCPQHDQGRKRPCKQANNPLDICVHFQPKRVSHLHAQLTARSRPRARSRSQMLLGSGVLGAAPRVHTQRVCARVPPFRALVPPRRCALRYEPAARLPRRRLRAVHQRHARALPRARASPSTRTPPGVAHRPPAAPLVAAAPLAAAPLAAALLVAPALAAAVLAAAASGAATSPCDPPAPSPDPPPATGASAAPAPAAPPPPPPTLPSLPSLPPTL